MFTLTDSAAAVLSETRIRRGYPDDVGFRISAGGTDNGEAGSYQLRFAADPSPDDVVIGGTGTPVYLSADVASDITGAVLDAVETPDGTKLVLKKVR